MKRFNSLYVGMYNDIKMIGFKANLRLCSFYDDEIEPLLIPLEGLDLTVKKLTWGIHYKKFYGHVFTWSLQFSIRIYTIDFANEIGMSISYFDTAKAAYGEG